MVTVVVDEGWWGARRRYPSCQDEGTEVDPVTRLYERLFGVKR